VEIEGKEAENKGKNPKVVILFVLEKRGVWLESYGERRTAFLFYLDNSILNYAQKQNKKAELEQIKTEALDFFQRKIEEYQASDPISALPIIKTTASVNEFLQAQKISSNQQIVDNKIESERSGVEVFQYFHSGVLVLDYASREDMCKALGRVTYGVERQFSATSVLSLAQHEQFLKDQRKKYNEMDRDFWDFDRPAHKQKAEDLADFFNVLWYYGYPLYPQEETLRQILLQNTVIGQNENEQWPYYGAKNKVVVAIYQRQGAERENLFYHVLKHGLYMSDPQYRQLCDTFWEKNLLAHEREFFQYLLYGFDYQVLPQAGKTLSAKQEYLLRNEFQAFLLNFDPVEGFFGQALWEFEKFHPAQAPRFKQLLLSLAAEDPANAQEYVSARVAQLRREFRTQVQRASFGYMFKTEK
jgi:hypothetical protein